MVSASACSSGLAPGGAAIAGATGSEAIWDGRSETSMIEPAADHEGVLDGVFQLPHVSGKRIGHEARHRRHRDARDASPLRRVEARDEPLDEERDVLGPAPERRQGQPDDVQAEVEVLAEAPVHHLRREVAVGRGEDPDVGLHRLDGAERRVLPLLKHPQKLDLYGRRQLADLVEEERPSLREGETAGLVLLGVGEGAADVAEQLRLDEGVRDGAAVDRDEGFARARPEVVDRPRDELLSRAGLPFDQDGRVAPGDERQHVAHMPHRRALGDDVVALVAGLELATQLGDLGEVAEHLDPSDHPSVLAAQRRRADGDRNGAPLLPEDRDLAVGVALAGPHAVAQEAVLLAAVARARTSPQKRPRTSSRRVARDLLRRPIEGGDPAVAVHGEDRVGDGVEDEVRVLEEESPMHVRTLALMLQNCNRAVTTCLGFETSDQTLCQPKPRDFDRLRPRAELLRTPPPRWHGRLPLEVVRDEPQRGGLEWR